MRHRPERANLKAFVRGIAPLALATLSLDATPAAGQGRTYQNPILDEDFPDPTAIKAGSTLYLYGTGTEEGGSAATPFIRMTKSTDLVHWSKSVTVLEKPRWASGSTWAPHVVKDPKIANRYVMFFSAKADVGQRGVPRDANKCLGVAVAPSPEGPFKPQPDPLRCGPGFFNIDPMAYQAPSGRMYLFWGSEHRPIVMQPLSDDLMGFVPGSRAIPMIAPLPNDKYANLIEGSWVLDHAGYQYFFTSGANCCGGPDGYAVTVARRKPNAGGTWERYTGGDHGAILKRNDTWVAPGHNGIFIDGAGQYWIVYHARRAGEAHKRLLLMDRIDWVEGWPRIAGDSPSSTPVAAPTP